MKLYCATLRVFDYEGSVSLTIGVYSDENKARNEADRICKNIISIVQRIKGRIGGEKYRYVYDFDEEYKSLPKDMQCLLGTYIDSSRTNTDNEICIDIKEFELDKTIDLK